MAKFLLKVTKTWHSFIQISRGPKNNPWGGFEANKAKF